MLSEMAESEFVAENLNGWLKLIEDSFDFVKCRKKQESSLGSCLHGFKSFRARLVRMSSKKLELLSVAYNASFKKVLCCLKTGLVLFVLYLSAY